MIRRAFLAIVLAVPVVALAQASAAAPKLSDAFSLKATLAGGDDVAPNTYDFRTAPTFDVGDGPNSWMRRTLFVTRGIRKPDHVVIDFYIVD